MRPEDICRAGVGRSFQITNLFPSALHRGEHPAWPSRRAIRSATTSGGSRALSPEIETETATILRYLGLSGIEHAEAGALSYGGQRLVDMGLALATKPRILLLDEPLAGLAAAERERIGALVKKMSAEVPVLLVEHDIDRVFRLADHVTVMNEGSVLVDGTRRGRALFQARAGDLHWVGRSRKSPPGRVRPRRVRTCS